MKAIASLAKLLPTLDKFEGVLIYDEDAEYLFPRLVANMQNLIEGNCRPFDQESMEVSKFLSFLAGKMWKMLNNKFFDLPPQYLKICGVTFLYKVIYMLFENRSQNNINVAVSIYDEAFLIGSITVDLYPGFDILRWLLEKFFEDSLVGFPQLELHVIAAIPRQKIECDFLVFESPSVETFRENCFKLKQPSLLLNTINHWPALNKWRDLNYILKVAGNRLVKVHIGSATAGNLYEYKSKVHEFLMTQFSTGAKASFPIEYIDEQNIFDQIVGLRKDIRVPDYCSVRVSQSEKIDVRAWMGPEDTITSLHRDTRNNLLCQVFGVKKLLLAPPDSARNLYLFDELPDTSSVDVEDINMDFFPLMQSVKFSEVTLQEGDCFYVPPGWFYYSRSLSHSVSVGFLWN